jgi:hypothetical protein
VLRTTGHDRASAGPPSSRRLDARTRHPPDAPGTVPDRPIALLATAIPSAAALSVAVHLVHAIPAGPRTKLADELLATTATNAADALHRCHRTLELDGLAHGYTAEEWLPVICDAAAALLESSRLDQEPPSFVQHTQDAVRWLSTSIACLDEDSRDASAAITDTLAAPPRLSRGAGNTWSEPRDVSPYESGSEDPSRRA